MNRELPGVQAGFRKGRRTRDQIANICWILEKAREFQKNIYFCFTDYTKASDCVDHNKLWKILKEMGILDHLTCLLRNLYASRDATIRTRNQIANILWIIEKVREFQKNIYFCFIDYAKALTTWITTNGGNYLKRWEYETTWPASWEICMQVKKQQLKLDME